MFCKKLFQKYPLFADNGKFLDKKLQNLPRNPSASLGIGQGMVVVDQIEATGRRNGVKLVVGQQFPEMLTRGATGAIKLIVRVIHLVAAHHGLQATFVEGAVMRHERQAFNQWFNLPPNVWKHRRIFGVLLRDAVNHRVPIQVIVRLGLDKGIERIHELAFFHNNDTNATHAGTLVVGGLKVYGGEVVHRGNDSVEKRLSN